MTQHDRQILWRAYQALPAHQKTAMRLTALIGDPVHKGIFAQALNATRAQSPNGKAWSGQSVQQLFESLRAQGLLEKDFTCAASLLHQIAVDACEGDQGELLLRVLTRVLPRSDREKPNAFGYYTYHRYQLGEDRDLFRRIRLAAYANDAAEFTRLRDLVHRAEDEEGGLGTLLPLFLAKLPADMDWLQRRPPEIREAFVHGMVAALLERGEVTSEAIPAITRFTQPGQPISPALNEALLWRDVLAGNFTGARNRIGALASHDRIAATAFNAVIQFLVGENAQAITGFREALKQHRNAARRRGTVLPGPIGVFHPLALLRANEVRFHAEVRNLLDAAFAGQHPVWSGYLAVRALLQVLSGQEDAARQSLVQIDTFNPKDPLARALTSLARLHSDSEAECKRVSQNEAAFDRIAAHLPLIGRIYAEILARTSPDQERWSAILRTMRMDQVIAFTDIIGFKPKWERAFERLTAFLSPSTTAPVVDSAAPQKRLVFLVDRMTNGIEALEQAFRAGAWTPGRPVSMKRLGEQKLDYLSAADRRVLETMRRQEGWYGGPQYQFDEHKSLLALIGHPHVFDARDRRHVELVGYPAELVVSESSAGYVFKLSHHAAGPEIFFEEETPTRWRLIEVTEKLVALQNALGKDGLTVPPHMRERIIPLLRTDNPVLPIRSELPDVESSAVEGVPAPVLRLRRSQDGLNVTLVVRPIGPDGPSYVPGHGGRSVLAMANGARQRVNRDLAKETAAAKGLIAGCTTLQPWSVAEFEWQIDGLEASLAFLEELESLPSPPALEWPEGEALKVTPAVGFKRLSLKVASARDWFEISGRIALDESLVVDMQEVLARLDKACGRFIPLSEGRFLALTAELKRQLQLLDAISDDSSHGRRLHPSAAAAIESLLDDAESVEADQRWHDLVANIRTTGVHQPTLPSGLQAELRDYQREGFVWLSRLARLEMGACLADDMGLGKTVQAIALLLEQADRGASLVIAPTSVCHNWECELARFASTLIVRRLAAVPDRRACIEQLGVGEVLIVSYGLLQQDDEALATRHWNVLVFDEAQNLKNVDTKRAQASRKLSARVRIALSGTPIENYLEELWSLFNTINPGLLGARERFIRRFATPIERGDMSTRNALRALIRPFILRRTKSAVLNELPPRTELTIEVTQSEEERAFYEALRRQALATVAALDGPSGQRKMHILAEITRLRRACCHPALIDPRSTIESAKLNAFAGLVDELLRNRHKALVFSQFIGHLDKVREALDARGVRYQYIDGAVPAQQRAARVAAFQAGEGDLFLISLKAGGTGLNLTAADYVIHLDPWWNPAVEDQASDRAHRIGQSRPVTVYRLVVADSIEERILDLHRHKRDLAADLLEGAEVSGRLSEDELVALIRQ